jgi:hypothetical protein
MAMHHLGPDAASLHVTTRWDATIEPSRRLMAAPNVRDEVRVVIEPNSARPTEPRLSLSNDRG